MYERMMIVVEDGDVSVPAMEEGLALARVHAAEVLFFHVLPNYVVPTMDMPPMLGGEPEQFRQAAEQTAQRVLAVAAQRAAEVGVRSSGVSGSASDAAECIANAAGSRGSQLIVIGSHGRTALQRLIFGSVVTRLITLAPVPVLVCKKQEGQSLRVDLPSQHGDLSAESPAPGPT